MDSYQDLSGLMKTLGHPVRLRILQVVRKEEACVCHLEAVLGQRQAAISQHLMRLRDVGLVIDRRDGMNVYYSLADQTIGELLDTAQQIVSGSPAQTDQMSFQINDGDEGLDCSCPKCEGKRVSAQKEVESVLTASGGGRTG